MTYSVIMPVYNGRDYFETALISAISSLEPEDEIIVIDDGSIDGGVEDIVTRNLGIVPIHHHRKENGGVATALNLGLELATNNVFAWLSHDDIYLPNRFSVDRALRKHSPDAVTVSDFYLLDNASQQLKFINSIHSLSKKQRFRLLSRRFLNGNCLTAPVQLLKACGGFDAHRKHTQDYALWLRMMKVSEFVAINDATVLSRQHPKQDSKAQPVLAKREYYSLLKENLSWKDFLDPLNLLDVTRIVNSILSR